MVWVVHPQAISAKHNTHNTHRIYTNFSKVRANFCLLLFGMSQEPANIARTKKLVQMNSSILGGFYSGAFFLIFP